MYTCACVGCACHGSCAEVRGQVLSVGFLLPPWFLGRNLSLSGFHERCFYRLNHLYSPDLSPPQSTVIQEYQWKIHEINKFTHFHFAHHSGLGRILSCVTLFCLRCKVFPCSHPHWRWPSLTGHLTATQASDYHSTTVTVILQSDDPTTQDRWGWHCRSAEDKALRAAFGGKGGGFSQRAKNKTKPWNEIAKAYRQNRYSAKLWGEIEKNRKSMLAVLLYLKVQELWLWYVSLLLGWKGINGINTKTDV